MPSVSSRRGGRVCLAGALTATLTLVLWSVNASARQTVRSMVQTCAELRREIALNLVDVSHGYDTSPELVLVLTGDTMDCTEGFDVAENQTVTIRAESRTVVNVNVLREQQQGETRTAYAQRQRRRSSSSFIVNHGTLVLYGLDFRSVSPSTIAGGIRAVENRGLSADLFRSSFRGFVTDRGGAISTTADLRVSDCIFIDNRAIEGAAIFVRSEGKLPHRPTLNYGDTLQPNVRSKRIRGSIAKLVVVGTKFERNSGGAVHHALDVATRHIVIFRGCEFVANQRYGGGAAVLYSNGSVSGANSRANNYEPAEGTDRLLMEDCRFSHNSPRIGAVLLVQQDEIADVFSTSMVGEEEDKKAEVGGAVGDELHVTLTRCECDYGIDDLPHGLRGSSSSAESCDVLVALPSATNPMQIEDDAIDGLKACGVCPLSLEQLLHVQDKQEEGVWDWREEFDVSFSVAAAADIAFEQEPLQRVLEAPVNGTTNGTESASSNASNSASGEGEGEGQNDGYGEGREGGADADTDGDDPTELPEQQQNATISSSTESSNSTTATSSARGADPDDDGDVDGKEVPYNATSGGNTNSSSTASLADDDDGDRSEVSEPVPATTNSTRSSTSSSADDDDSSEIAQNAANSTSLSTNSTASSFAEEDDDDTSEISGNATYSATPVPSSSAAAGGQSEAESEEEYSATEAGASASQQDDITEEEEEEYSGWGGGSGSGNDYADKGEGDRESSFSEESQEEEEEYYEQEGEGGDDGDDVWYALEVDDEAWEGEGASDDNDYETTYGEGQGGGGGGSSTGGREGGGSSSGVAGFNEEGGQDEEEEDGDPSVDDNSFVVKVAAGMLAAVAVIGLGFFVSSRRRQTALRGEFQGVPHRGLTEGDNL